jgi:hypothetical protein
MILEVSRPVAKATFSRILNRLCYQKELSEQTRVPGVFTSAIALYFNLNIAPEETCYAVEWDVSTFV